MIKTKFRGDYVESYGGRTQRANNSRTGNSSSTGIIVSTVDSRPATAAAGAPPNRPPGNPNTFSGTFGNGPDNRYQPGGNYFPSDNSNSKGQSTMFESYPTSKRTDRRYQA